MTINMYRLRSKYLQIGKLLWLAGLLTACQNLPKNPHLPSSTLTDHAVKINKNSANVAEADFLALIKEQTKQHPQLSGYQLIASGADAFSARTLLIASAQKTIDVQYYIWHDDTTGIFLLKQLWAAANRGVIVRLLLDDFNSTPVRDRLLSAFASHPNISVRLANPLIYRKYRKFNFVTHPLYSQTRMHNKSMTFDNLVSIVGGRNIGDEYLNSDNKRSFADLDVLIAGKIINDIHQSFESYWRSNSAFDIQILTKNKHYQTEFDFTLSDKELSTYQRATTYSSFNQPINHIAPLRWTHINFVADDVKKLNKKAQNDELLVNQLRTLLPTPKKHLTIISSYFAPTKNGVKILKRLSENGVHISILTNAYKATDVRPVHMGYGHWRAELLRSGIQLYEFKNNAQSPLSSESVTQKSLHAKAFAIDDQAVFIGSYNIDPRSANINSELGVIIDDQNLAEHIHKALNNHPPSNTNPTLLYQTYKVEITPHHKLQWRTIENDKEVIYTKEPKTTLINRTNIALFSLLPIDGFL